MATQRAPRPTVNKNAQWIDMVCICMHDAIGLVRHSSSQGWPHTALRMGMVCKLLHALQFKPCQHCPHHLAHGWARPHRPTLVSCCWYTPFYPLTPDDTGFSALSALVQRRQPHASACSRGRSHSFRWFRCPFYRSILFQRLTGGKLLAHSCRRPSPPPCSLLQRLLADG
jgi:hypothetical protein